MINGGVYLGWCLTSNAEPFLGVVCGGSLSLSLSGILLLLVRKMGKGQAVAVTCENMNKYIAVSHLVSLCVGLCPKYSDESRNMSTLIFYIIAQSKNILNWRLDSKPYFVIF